jgi:hypothetical protein
MPSSAQVSVGTTATLLVAASIFHQTAYLHNLSGGGGGGGGGGNNPIFIGAANVTTSNGYKLNSGASLSLMVGDHEALYAICASGTVDVSVLVQVN